jgi:hypothetical protein
MRPFGTAGGLAHLSPDDRLSELASIFAAAVLRLRERVALAMDAGSDSGSDSGPTCLEVRSESVLSGHHG